MDLDRALRVLLALLRAPELAALKDLSVPNADAKTRIRRFRNGIAHGDADLAKGKGRGRLRPSGQTRGQRRVLGVRLEFSELAAWLQQLHDYLLAVNKIA